MARSVRTATLAALLLPALLLPGRLASQGARHAAAPDWHVEAGAAVFSTPWVKDDNGTTVNGGPGPSCAAGVDWPTSTLTRVGFDARLTSLPVTIHGAGGPDVSADRAVAIDLLAIVAVRPSPRLALHGGIGATHLHGPDAVAPFAAGNASPWRLGAEAGMEVAVSRRWPIALTGVVHGMRVGSASDSDPVTSPGAVTRVLVGVRYGR